MRLSSRAAKEVPNSGALAAHPFVRDSVDLRAPFGGAFLEYLKSMWEQRALNRRSRNDTISGACVKRSTHADLNPRPSEAEVRF